MKPYLLFALALAACAPTQVVVYVDTSLGVPCEIDEIAFDTNGDSIADRTGTISGGPISLTLVNSGGGDYETLHVIGRKAGVDVLAGTANIKFNPGGDESFSIALGPECTPANPCTFDMTHTTAGIKAPEPMTRSFCSAGYSLTTRTPSTPPSDPLVKNACSIAVATSATVTFGGTCQTSQKVCVTNTDCAGESPALCVIGEVPVPDNVVSAFKATGFKFAGTPIDGIWLGEGGYAVFTDTRPNKTRAAIGLSSTLDKSTTPAPGVMAFWDDLLPKLAANSACLALTSDGTLWITWNACFTTTGCASGDNLVFTVGLESSTDIVRIGYLSMTSSADTPDAAGNHAVVGVRAKLTPACTPDQCNATTGRCMGNDQPCGYTQAFAKTPQPMPLTTTSFVFTPNDPR
jgi:hypothetical protein